MTQPVPGILRARATQRSLALVRERSGGRKVAPAAADAPEPAAVGYGTHFGWTGRDLRRIPAWVGVRLPLRRLQS